MNFLLMLLTAVPLPSMEQRLMLLKQESTSFQPGILGDYWDERHDFDVLNYDIDMSVDIPADSVWATVTITFQALSDTLDTLGLNFHWVYTIDEIKEDARSLSWTPVMMNEFKVALGREVSTGETISVAISYHGKPAEQDGLFINDQDDPLQVTYTNSEPQGARHWIPCYDAPSDKATFTQRITVPAGYDLVANGTLESLQKNGSWWTYTWEEHYPQATYLIAFCASKYFLTSDTFALVDGTNVPIRTRVLEDNDVRDKFLSTPHILEYFSDIFPPYPFRDEKYDHVHADFGGAMENATCTFINTFADWGDDWSWVIAHEMSHDWWGDWLTCATWADLWLNEGFATYCECLWWEELYGEEGYHAYARAIMDVSMEYGQNHPIYDPPWEDLFGVVTYYKGGSVMHMLRQVLGDENFFQGLNTYALRHANSSVITDEFQAVMEEESGQDLDWFFDEWIYGPGHPYYEIGWEPVTHLSTSSAAYEIEFALAQTQNKSSNYYPYRMPVEVAVYSGGVEELFFITDSLGYQRFTVEVTGEPDSFRFDPYDKLLCEVTQHDNIDDVPDPGIEEQPSSNTLALTADGIFTDILKIGFTQPDNQPVRLSLYDAAGRRVKEFYQGTSKDFYRVYPVSGLAPGVYFVRLESENSLAVARKVIKLR